MDCSWGLLVVYFLGLVIYSGHSQVQGLEGDLRPGCNESLAVFECVGDQLCVAATSLCNGIPDCPQGQDEAVQQCGCLANEFSCGNSCVALVKRCDRQQDCLNGEDEDDCNTYLCPMTHFKCNNHFCVPLAAVCDFVDDCGDNSDEATCSHRPCWNKEFRCDNGQCVRPGELCDGHPDCRDLSDEKNCDDEDFVECGDGNRVHRYYWCDQWPDCALSHLDEINCQECNASYEFQCPNGRCIRRANLCDSQCDCAPPPTTGSLSDVTCVDEVNCDDYYTIHHGLATCRLGESLACSVPSEQPRDPGKERCIAQRFLCDGHNDCQNGLYLSDEFGCDIEGKDPDEKVFTCKDNRTLPAYLRCDFKFDCLHGDDEDNCTKPVCSEDEFRCASGQCISLLSRCDIHVDCLDKSDEIGCGMFRCMQGMAKCHSGGQCLPTSLWCDHYIDCPDGSDERDCDPAECGAGQHRCDSGQCVEARLRCYESGTPRAGCSDTSNLRHCEDWECAPDQFKCKNGPCVNRSLLCDARVDCLGYWDDEDNCSFSCSTMAPQCDCRDVHINCTARGLVTVPVDAEKEITWFYLGKNKLSKSISNQTFIHLDRLIYLDLSANDLMELPVGVFSTLWQLSVLDLHDNHLSRLANGSFTGLASLKGLHLKGNQLEVLESLAFYGLTSLKTLDLSHQKISYIQPGAFVGLRSLIGLDLSYNEISYLEQGSFRGVPNLIFIGLNGNQIRNIEPSVFLNVPALNKLVTDEFRLCCLARHASVCLPPPDEFSSCEDLMSNLVLRLCVWLLAGVAIVGNLLVIVWRSRYSYCNQVHSFLITNLALGDFLMGSYLLMIAVVDRYYRGVYFIHDSEWRSSRLCAMAGFLSTFSSELSVFTLTVITLDRFLVIIFPFRVSRLEMARTKWLMVLGWLLAALLSALPLLDINYFHNFYGRSGVCLALHITPDKPSGWEYSVFVFLILNLVSFSVIAASYLWMFVAARTTQLAVSRERRSTDSAMAFRMSLLVVTDAACWVPIIGLGLFSLAGFTVPPQVFAWVAVFVLPLNAAVNPVLYTLSTAPFVTPARHGLLSFRRSFKFSRNTFTSTLPTRVYGSEREQPGNCYTISKRASIRWQPRVEPVEGMPLSSFVT